MRSHARGFLLFVAAFLALLLAGLAWRNAPQSDEALVRWSAAAPRASRTIVPPETEADADAGVSEVAPHQDRRLAPRAAAPIQERLGAGRVVDLAGAPVPLVRVTARGGDPDAAARTNADGVFEWPQQAEPDALLVVDDSRWVTLLTSWGVSSEPSGARLLVVAPALEVRGRITSEGAPLPGARVGLVVDLREARERAAVALTAVPLDAAGATGADGRFVLRAAPAASGVTLKVSHVAHEHRRVELVPDSTAAFAEVELDLRRLGAAHGVVRGRVVACDGGPAPARVSVTWGANGARADAAGEFELALGADPGAAELVVRAPGCCPATYLVTLDDALSAPLRLRLGAPLEALRGSLLDAAPKAAKGAWVELHEDRECAGVVQRVRADSGGRFEFEALVPGEYWLVVRPRQGGAPRREGPFSTGRPAAELVIRL